MKQKSESKDFIMSSITFNFSHPEQIWDVLVVGGGATGVFAAIAAAKNDAKTLLIEKNGVLGGTITTAGVNFPGLFHAWGELRRTNIC